MLIAQQFRMSSLNVRHFFLPHQVIFGSRGAIVPFIAYVSTPIGPWYCPIRMRTDSGNGTQNLNRI
jgi:hypothetical protein